MKKNAFILTCLTLALCAGFGINRAAAQVFANDDAAAYTSWANGNNFGFGFAPWVFYNTGGAGGAVPAMLEPIWATATSLGQPMGVSGVHTPIALTQPPQRNFAHLAILCR